MSGPTTASTMPMATKKMRSAPGGIGRAPEVVSGVDRLEQLRMDFDTRHSRGHRGRLDVP